jgi:hypothetical protein
VKRHDYPEAMTTVSDFSWTNVDVTRVIRVVVVIIIKIVHVILPWRKPGEVVVDTLSTVDGAR